MTTLRSSSSKRRPWSIYEVCTGAALVAAVLLQLYLVIVGITLETPTKPHSARSGEAYPTHFIDHLFR